jgi:hypothetical protein
MIRRHEFNSVWWGSPVGIVDDDAFFDLGPTERAALLAPWAWVEHKAPAEAARSARIAVAGFVPVDVQLAFRIGLAPLRSSPSLERLDVVFADEPHAVEGAFSFDSARLADFAHERFEALPGIIPERTNERYALWARELAASAPATALAVREGSEVQGWFLSRPIDTGLHLTLAMLARDARISGHSLYQRALLAYAARGHRLGMAEFSASNTAVHNIYAALGARFVSPTACWMWIAPLRG